MKKTTFFGDFNKNLKNSVHRWQMMLSLFLMLFACFLGQAQTFTYTGSVQTVTLSAGAYQIEVWGANGGDGIGGTGGKGGYSKGILNVSSSTTYYIYVGGKGTTASAAATGGWNGGGGFLGTFTAGNNSGTGGGGTDIRTTQNTTFADRIIVAGGGGGAVGYGTYTGNGGNGGGIDGGNGGSSRGATYAGGGGSQTTGGTAATGGISGYSLPGALGVGGDYSSTGTLGGTAGGGGYYGGGSGHWGGAGGGGSSYIGGVSSGVTNMLGESGFVVNPDTAGNGMVIITSMAPCAGTPTAGTASVTPVTRTCIGDPFTISALGATGAGGVTYQWQRSNAGANNFTDIPGATSSSYVVTNQTVASDYRYVVTCTHSSSTSISNVVTMGQPTGLSYMYENFDSYAVGTILPTCWTRLFGSGTLSIASTTPVASGNRHMQMTATTTQISSLAVLPDFSNISAGTHWLRFKMRLSTGTGGNMEVGYITNVADQSTYVTIQTLPVNNALYTSADSEYTVIPGALPAGARLAFKNPTDAKTYFIDDVYWEQVPNCFPPTSFVTTGVSPTTASFSWSAPTMSTPVGYEVYYSTTNVAPTPSTVLNATNSTTSASAIATVNGLTPATTYYFWVRSACSGENSSWVGVVTATTSCLPVATLPWTENFDSLSSVGAAIIPNCWKNVKGTKDWTTAVAGTYNAPRSTPNYIYIAYGNTIASELWTPGFALTAGTAYEFSFHHRNGISGTLPGFTGDVLVNSTQDVSGATNLGTFIVATDANTVYQRHKVTFIPPATGTYHFALSVTSNGSPWYLGFDDFEMKLAPTCIEPTNLSISNIQTTSADVLWVAPSTGTSPAGYEVYYSTSSTAPTTSTVLDATNSVASTSTVGTISGLTSATTYYVWVRSNCGGGDKSIWSTMGTFTTACAGVSYMYQNFDTTATGSVVPTCWARIVATSGAGSQTVTTTTPASAPNNIYQYATSSQTPVIVVLPSFSNISAGTHRLRFKARATTTGGSLDVGYVTDINDASTFVIIQNLPINNTSYTATDSEYIVIPLGLPSNARLAIVNAADSRSYYWDNVYWEPTPTCYPPTDVVFTGTTYNSTTVSWTPPTAIPASTYDVYYSTSATAPTSTTTPNYTGVSATSQVLGSLTPSTSYYVWVRSNCGAGGASEWSLVKSFYTLCQPPTLLSTNGATVCQNGSATLTATTSAGSIKWFDAATGGTQVGTGTSFSTPNLTTTTNYWAEASTGGISTVGKTGIESNASGTGGGITTYMNFTADSDFILRTVDIFPYSATTGTTGTITIELRSSTGASLMTKTVNTIGANTAAASTAQTVTLDFPVTGGASYRLGVSAWTGTTNMFRDDSNFTYPYTIPGVVSITGPSLAGYYYFFYNWKVETGCASSRQQVTATVDPTCLGTSEVVAKKDNAIYPNPFTDVINISKVEDVKSATVVDASGRVVKTITEVSRTVNLAELKEGLYILTIKYKDGTTSSHKIIKK